MDLREWMVLYVKHKDMLARRLQKVEEKPDGVIFHFKDYRLQAYSLDRLAIPANKDKTLLVTLNTKENINFLIHHFADFAKNEGLTVVFANPRLNEKWVIVPHTHSRIADGDISLGINSLAQGVPFA